MCEKHPNYKQKFKPVAQCLDCWKEWAAKLEAENKILRKDNKVYMEKLTRYSRVFQEVTNWRGF